jgi:tetratricopeptide (TPR) repeat protein
MKLKIFASSLALALLPASGADPLFENSWNNPQFVARFVGTYGFDTALNPGITQEEKLVFDKLVPLIQSQPSQAIAALKVAITPTSSAALDFTLGNLYFQTKSFAEATTAYQGALKKFPNFLRVHKNLGRLFVQQGDAKSALAHLLRVIELGGAEGDIYGLVGYCYLQGGAVTSALDAYRSALLFAPKSRDWRMGKIQCLVNLGEHKEAAAMLEELITEKPDDAGLWMLQANAYVASGNSADAAVNLELVRQMGKATPVSLALLGDIYINANQPDLALSAYQDLLKGEQIDQERALRAARILASRGAWTEADAYLKELNQRLSAKLPASGQSEVASLLAKVALARGEDDKAAAMLTKVLETDPLNGKALLLLADYHWKKSDRERADLYYTRAATVEDVRVEALLQHARMNVALKEFAAATKLLARAQSIKPQAHVGDFLAKVEAAARATRF